MFKRTLIASLMMASFSAYAYGPSCGYSLTTPHCCECAPNLGSGWYLGGGIGYDFFHEKKFTHFILRPSDPPTPFDGQTLFTTDYEFGEKGFMDELFLGYGYRCNNLYLAGELFAGRSSTLYVNTNTSEDRLGLAENFFQKDWINYVEGVRIRPGYFVSCNTLFYVPIGYVRGHYQQDIDATNNVHEFSRFIHGGQIGWGIETPVTSCLSLRLGYLYTGYERFTVNNLTIDTGLTRERRYKISNDQMVLDFVYNFGCARPIQPIAPSFGNGFYVGVQGGRSTFVNHNSYTTVDLPNDPIADNSILILSKENYPGTGGFAGIFAGYGKTLCHNFYIGAEALADWQSIRFHYQDNTNFPGFIPVLTGTTGDNLLKTVKVKEGYGISIQPGYFLTCNTMLYGRVGEKRSRFHSFVLNQGFPTFTQDFDRNGTLLGLGLQTSLGCHWSIRTEFDHTIYQSFNFAFIQPPFDPEVNPLGQTKTQHDHYRVNQYSLGLVYSF